MLYYSFFYLSEFGYSEGVFVFFIFYRFKFRLWCMHTCMRVLVRIFWPSVSSSECLSGRLLGVCIWYCLVLFSPYLFAVCLCLNLGMYNLFNSPFSLFLSFFCGYFGGVFFCRLFFAIGLRYILEFSFFSYFGGMA